MARHLLFGLIFVLFGCNSGRQQHENSISNKTPNDTDLRIEHKILNDTTLLKDYRALLISADQREAVFIKTLIATITRFSAINIDTTVISTGKIDSDNSLDTIKSRVFKEKDDIIMHSSWSKGGNILWSDTLKNPYLWISNNPLFDYERRSFWVTFTIGFLYAVPDSENIQKYSNLLEIAGKIGIQSLENLGIKEDPDSYLRYLRYFKNDLVSWGDPEEREGLFIWYEPKQKFVLFYHD